MKLIPANLGANKRNLIALGALLVILAGVFIYDMSSGGSSSTPSTPAAGPFTEPAPLRAPAASPVSLQRTPPVRRQTTRVEDFRPTLKLKEGTDVSKIDPTVKVDVLAKLRQAEMKGGTRSVFAFGSAPPPPVDPIKVEAAKKAEEQAKIIAQKKEEDAKKGPPPPPPAPPIPLKFFGYSTRGSAKRAFFLDGDDIDVAGENDIIKNRYKVIRIGVNSVVVEDEQSKNQQTLPLVAEVAG
jgi:hypothetical protein